MVGTHRERLRDLLRAKEEEARAGTKQVQTPEAIKKAVNRKINEAKSAHFLWEHEKVVWISQEHQDDQ